MSPPETPAVARTFGYEPPSIVVIQPDVGELELEAATPFIALVVILVAVDVATWGTAVRNITKATNTTTKKSAFSGPPGQGPSLVTLPGLPAADD
jgi:hypothetical protein